jgi:ABC-2 type transport system ATP-binding protein
MDQTSPRSEDRQGSADADASTDLEATEAALVAENLTKTFGSGDDAVRAVRGVDLRIERGTVVGLLGPNGAGKTTAIKMLLGLIDPDEGRATVGGVDVTDAPREAYRSVSAMLEGARNVYWRLTVRENVRFFARLGGRELSTERIDDLIEGVGLTEKADETVNELSRGMKQKVSLACTLARATPIAFLDEPTLGLDVESSLDLRRELRRQADDESRTVVLSSHDMDVIEAVCDRVIIMNDGQVVADDTVEGLKEVFRTQAYRVTLDGDPSAALRDRLGTRFDAGDWVRDGDHWRFDAANVRGEEFYALTDLLRESSCSLVRVDSLEPDMEDVFLEVTSER